jgi:hypothetical protein
MIGDAPKRLGITKRQRLHTEMTRQVLSAALLILR